MIDESRVGEAGDLLVAVARCPIVADCVTGSAPGHPCEQVVLSQWPAATPASDRASAWKRWHQLPEPWVGHLRQAPILFVSSNPSIGGAIGANLEGSAPLHRTTWERDDSEIVRRATRAFDDELEHGVRAPEGEVVPYWAAVKARAEELLGNTVRPGLDYALTEAVRCKSKEELGVQSALGVCSRNYLRATIVVSGARVIVGLGRHLRTALTRVLPLESDAPNFHTTQIGPRQLLIALIPHPNARRPDSEKTIAANVSAEQLMQLRAAARPA